MIPLVFAAIAIAAGVGIAAAIMLPEGWVQNAWQWACKRFSVVTKLSVILTKLYGRVRKVVRSFGGATHSSARQWDETSEMLSMEECDQDIRDALNRKGTLEVELAS